MKIGRVEKILIALSVTVVLVSFAFAAINTRSAADQVVVLKTLGMTCGSCAGKIEQALAGQPGIAEVTVDIDAARVIVAYDARATTPEAIANAVTASGFRSGVVRTLTLEQHRNSTGRDGAGEPQNQKDGCGKRCC